MGLAAAREWGLCGPRVLFSLGRRFGLVTVTLDRSFEACVSSRASRRY